MGQATQQGDGNEDRWVGHPVLAAALKAVLYVVPLVASSAAVVLLAHVVPVFGSRLLWLATLGLVAVGVSVVVERLVRRLLPLATLLKLTMLFPDKAPSRYKLARSAGNPEVLAERLARKRDATALGAAEQVLALITALGNHDRRTRGHSERVRVFADLLAEELHLDQPARDRLRWAALLHDLGKLSVAATVLNKPAKLDDREFTLMKQHPERGAELAAPLLPWLGEWGRGILEHHEKYDGSGYPAGLSGTDISVAGRVVGLVDAFETMTAARPYKKPMATRAARQELTDCAGAHFDPVMVRAFLTVSLPRLVWAMGPLSFLFQLPMLSALAQTGTRAGQLSGQAAVTASTVASAGVVATAGVLPWAAPAAYEQPATAQAAASEQPASAPAGSSAEQAAPATPPAPTDLPGVPEPQGLEAFGQTSQLLLPPSLEPASEDAEQTAPRRAPARPVTSPAPRSSAPVEGTDAEPAPTTTAPTEPPASAPTTVPTPTTSPAPAPAATPPTPSPARPPSPTPTPPTASASPRPTASPTPTAPPTPPTPTTPAPEPAPVAPPSVVLTSGPTGTHTTSGVVVSFHSPDKQASAFQCRLDDGAWIGCATSATAQEPATWTVFPDNGDHEIRVRASSPHGGWGPAVSTGTFRMSVPPQTVLHSAPSGTVSTSDVALRFSSQDDSVTAYSCSIDGGSWSTCTSPLALTLPDGSHRVEVRATSPLWGTGPAVAATFAIDAPGPRVTFTQTPADDHPSSTLELAFTSDQAGSSFVCRIDGEPESSCTSPLLLTGLADGTHHVHVRATHPLTGQGPKSPLSFTVRSAPHTPPTTVLDAVPPATSTTSSVSVEFSSPETDATFRCSLDGGSAQLCSSPLELTGLANGPHTISVHAVSSAGVVGPAASTSFTVAVPPSVVFDDVPSGTVSASRTVTAVFSSDQSDATFECAVDDGALAACVSPWSVELGNGVHTLTVRATDPVTGASSTRTSPAFTVDVRPHVTITAAPTGTVGTTFSLSFVSDVASAVFECVADSGTQWARCLSGDSFTLPAGDHTMSVRALADGVYGPPATTGTFTVVDASGPLVIDAKPDATTTATTARFTWHGGTNPDYQCRLDNGSWTPCAGESTYSGLAPGTYTFGLRSMGIDDKGQYSNIDTVSYTWTVVSSESG